MSATLASRRPIAILGGTGPAGMGLALRWARAGETIIIGSRDAQRAQQIAATIQQKAGPAAKVTGMENSAACAAADILMLTVPFEGQAALLKQLRKPTGKIKLLFSEWRRLFGQVSGYETYQVEEFEAELQALMFFDDKLTAERCVDVEERGPQK